MASNVSFVHRWSIGVFFLVLIVSSCGGDDDPSSTASDSGESSAPALDRDEGRDSDPGIADAEAFAEDLADDLEKRQEAEGGGSATLTVGDEQWTFERLLCAFGEDEIGQEGAEVVVSGIQEGLQLYVSIDDFGHVVSLDDIEDFENPAVSLSTGVFMQDEFIEVDGKSVTAEAEFVDYLNEGSSDPIPGSLQATCP